MICLGQVGTGFGTNRCYLQKGHKGECKARKTKLRDLVTHIERRELVNHPRHYGGDTTHETVKCLNAWGLEKDALLWNTVKYISRAGKKNDLLEDLRKAKWYLDRRITELENAGKSTAK